MKLCSREHPEGSRLLVTYKVIGVGPPGTYDYPLVELQIMEWAGDDHCNLLIYFAPSPQIPTSGWWSRGQMDNHISVVKVLPSISSDLQDQINFCASKFSEIINLSPEKTLADAKLIAVEALAKKG